MNSEMPNLAAAAPDLLRVAELLVSWLDEEEGAHKLCDAAIAAIRKAKTPTAPASEVERERIARIIDPNDWSLIDHFKRNKNRLDLVERIPGTAAASLAKADAILSTIAPPADDLRLVLRAARKLVEAYDSEEYNDPEGPAFIKLNDLRAALASSSDREG